MIKDLVGTILQIIIGTEAATIGGCTYYHVTPDDIKIIKSLLPYNEKASLAENDKELQIEKCLKLSVDLWNEYNKLPVEHPNQVNEFASAIHVIQEKLALKIARIYRPDLFPNKMKEEL